MLERPLILSEARDENELVSIRRRKTGQGVENDEAQPVAVGQPPETHLSVLFFKDGTKIAESELPVETTARLPALTACNRRIRKRTALLVMAAGEPCGRRINRGYQTNFSAN